MQTKLRVGAANDPLEREADAVAAAVMRRLSAAPVAAPTAASATTADDAAGGEQDAAVRRSISATTAEAASAGHGADGGDASPEVARRVQQSSGGGRPIEPGVKTRIEQAFGADFSGVRIHDDSSADQLSRSLNARAFTTRSDIYFAAGQYRPGTASGQELLAHELTHTLQQAGSRVQRSTAPAATVSDDRSAPVRRWDMKSGIDIDDAVRIRTIPSGQAVFMLADASGEEIVVKAEDYPIGLMKLATLVHQSVHDIETIDSDLLDGTQKQKMIAKIGDPAVTADPGWDALGASPAWAKWNTSGLPDADHARAMHQMQITPLALQAQKFASGRDAVAQIKDTSRTGFRSLVQSPRYMRQLGAAAAVDMFLGNADRLGGVVNLGNWMATADEKVQLIDNMDANARHSFSKSNIATELFPSDMVRWAANPEAWYAAVVDRLLAEAQGKGGDAGIVAWAAADGGHIRRFMIEDLATGFRQTVDKLVKLYGTDKSSAAGRAVKEQAKGIDNDESVDYWEVLKARARFLRNPKKAASLTKTVTKRQKKMDKKKK